MDQTASQLRQELDRKRDDLTRDVDRIEEKVKASFDLNRQIDEHPLAAVGLSIAGGFLLGNMVGGGKKEHASGSGSYSYPSGGQPSSAFYSGASTPGPYWSGSSSYGSGAQWNQSSQPSQSNGPGIVGEVKAGLKESFRRGSGTNVDDALTNITAALTAVLMDKAKELLDRNLPGFADRYEQVAHSGDAPMSGAGMGQQGFASGLASGGQAAPTSYPSPAGQAPYGPSERAGSPADATTMGDSSAKGGSSAMGASRPSAAGGSASANAADFRDSATRDAGMRDSN
jgi:hypothetical protein